MDERKCSFTSTMGVELGPELAPTQAVSGSPYGRGVPKAWFAVKHACKDLNTRLSVLPPISTGVPIWIKGTNNKNTSQYLDNYTIEWNESIMP